MEAGRSEEPVLLPAAKRIGIHGVGDAVVVVVLVQIVPCAVRVRVPPLVRIERECVLPVRHADAVSVRVAALRAVRRKRVEEVASEPRCQARSPQSLTLPFSGGSARLRRQPRQKLVNGTSADIGSGGATVPTGPYPTALTALTVTV